MTKKRMERLGGGGRHFLEEFVPNMLKEISSRMDFLEEVVLPKL